MVRVCPVNLKNHVPIQAVQSWYSQEDVRITAKNIKNRSGKRLTRTDHHLAKEVMIAGGGKSEE